MSGSVVLRQLLEEDLEALVALEKLVFGQEAWSRSALTEEISSTWGYYIGAFEAERLVGYGGIKGDQEGDLMTLAVVPDRREAGVGRRLLAQLLEGARIRGIRKLFLEVRVSNDPAVRLYRSFGFKEVGVIPGYYRNPVEDAALMLRTEPAGSPVV